MGVATQKEKHRVSRQQLSFSPRVHRPRSDDLVDDWMLITVCLCEGGFDGRKLGGVGSGVLRLGMGRDVSNEDEK